MTAEGIPALVLQPPVHGADIAAASARYGIPTRDWLDLSAAINPRAYPVTALASSALRQLPYSLREAHLAASAYCGAASLPVFAAGSQVVIQWLPFVHRSLHGGRRVAVPKIGYAEHAFRWRWAGYDIVYYDPRVPEQIDELLQRDAIDVLVVITPHNPFAQSVTTLQLLSWHVALQRRSGWLIVDEAFVDAAPRTSLAHLADRPGLVVLRSLGKFFGLAGVRCGYAFCDDAIARPLEIAIGPWSLSVPAVMAATEALRDENWQRSMRAKLTQWSRQNRELLLSAPWADIADIHQHPLFNSIELPRCRAVAIEDLLARHAIRIRRIEIDDAAALLRFGLIDPHDDANWVRLETALAASRDI